MKKTDSPLHISLKCLLKTVRATSQAMLTQTTPKSLHLCCHPTAYLRPDHSLQYCKQVGDILPSLSTVTKTPTQPIPHILQSSLGLFLSPVAELLPYSSGPQSESLLLQKNKGTSPVSLTLSTPGGKGSRTFLSRKQWTFKSLVSDGEPQKHCAHSKCAFRVGQQTVPGMGRWWDRTLPLTFMDSYQLDLVSRFCVILQQTLFLGAYDPNCLEGLRHEDQKTGGQPGQPNETVSEWLRPKYVAQWCSTYADMSTDI